MYARDSQGSKSTASNSSPAPPLGSRLSKDTPLDESFQSTNSSDGIYERT